VLFVDLYERIAQRYDAMGPEAVAPLFADQGVHTSYAGAEINAARVMEGLLDLPRASLQTLLNASRAAQALQ
jgi:hypothetical protein